MATIILDRAASNTTRVPGWVEFTPQDGDIYILTSTAVSEFRFLGDADFEVRIEDAGPYSENASILGPATLSFEDTTNPTVNYGNDVDARLVRLNANGDSLTVNAGDNVSLGPINGSGVQTYSGMPTGDGLNADGGGLTITTGSGTFVPSRIDGPSNGADANYTFGDGGEFGANATVTGSVGGNTTIVVGDNAEVSVNAGFIAPSGELNGNTQSITIGNNAVHDPNYAPGWEVTVAGTNGEKIINIGDNVTVDEVGFGSEGYENLIDFDNNTTYVNPTGGTLTAGENLTVRTPIWGTEEGSTYILGDGWDVPFDLRGAGANNGDDPEAQLILGAPKEEDGTSIEILGSGNDLISIMPPEAPADDRSNLIGSLTSNGWAENDDGSYSPTALTNPTNSYLVGPSNNNGDLAIAGFSGPALGAAAPNQIVDGENDAELMGDGYDDSDGATNSGGDIIGGADGDNDVILGNGGNDTINAGAGDDEVYGGSGDDVIDGGAGNDTLTGDFASDVTDTVVDNSTVEGDDILEGGAGDDVIYGDSGNSLSAGGEGVPGDTLGDGPGSTGGGYARVSAQSVSNGNHSFSTDAFYLGNDIPVLDDANRNAITGVSFSQDGEGTDRTFGLDELTFTGAQRSFVGLVTVQDSDIRRANDQFSSSISGGFQDTTVVSSGTADFTMNDGQVFQGIRVNFVRGPDGETYMMPDDGPSPFAFNAFRAMLSNNSSGIDSFTIATGSGDDAGINPIEGNWADGQFFELTEGDGGDDTIIGGEGADTMFGEGGDDTFVVGSAAEGAGDVISGGFGPDEITDNDTLDLTGAGPVTINATADANDAGAQSGTVTFADGSTLTFEGIETIIQDPDNTAPVLDAIGPQTAPENSTDPVFTANAVDPDGDQPVYSLTGPDAALFDIDPVTGEVTPTAPLDFENPTDANGDGVYDVTVVATDPEGLTDEEPVQITVGDVNEAPVLDAIGPQTAPENSTDPVFTANAVDPDGDQPVYSLTGPDAALFDIDPVTGEVTPTAPLDFENPTDDNGDGIYDVTVVATDPNDPALTDEEPVQITVGDVNEAPVLDAIGPQTAPENSTDPVFTANAVDPDGDQPVYSLTGPDAALFDIDPVTGEVTPTAPLDFENPTDANGDGVYDVTVVATDPNDPALTDEEPVAITVGDVNEAPVLDAIGPQTAPENSTDPVFTANAVDPDGDQPVYSLEGPDAALFSIDPDTGEVTPTAPLDFENPTDANGDGVYDVTVVATDPEGLTDEEPVQITVGDVQPTITLTPGDGVLFDAEGRPVLTEGGAPVPFTVSIDVPLADDLVITVASDDTGEATVPTTVTIPAGETSAEVLVTPVDDTEVDGDQFPTITATAPDTNPAEVEVVVQDDDLPTITLTPGDGVLLDAEGRPVLTEGGAPVPFTVSIDVPLADDLVITVASDDTGEATVPTTVTIPAGETSAEVLVTPVDDTEVDGDQFPTITATAPDTNPAEVEVVVQDDDLPTITLTPGDGVLLDAEGRPVLTEGGAPVPFTVSIDVPLADDLVITVASDDTGEATVPTTVTIPAGETSAEVLVTPVDDTEVDGDQFPTITATAPDTNPAEVEVVVQDDDLPTITLTPGDGVLLDAEGRPVLTEGGAPVPFTVSIDVPLADDLVITVASDDTGEATVPTTVTIPAGETSAEVLVTPVDDTEVDGDQFPTITATAPDTNPAEVEVVVQDDDLPTITLTPGDGVLLDAEGRPVLTEGGAPVPFTVSIDVPLADDLVITVASDDTGEATVPTTVTIPAGETSAEVLVTPVDDTEVDGDQFPTITATAPDTNPAEVEVVVQDDDLPTITLTPGALIETDAEGRIILTEGGADLPVIVAIDRVLTEDLVVTLVSSDTTEATVFPEEVTIFAGTTEASIFVSPQDDFDIDGDQFPTISATAPDTNPAELETVVQDDDLPTITLTPGDGVLLDAEGRPVLTEGGAPVPFTVSIDVPLADDLVITLASDDTGEATVPTTVTIPAGATSAEVLVTPVADGIVDGDQFPTITATAPDTNPAEVEVVVQDVVPADLPFISLLPGALIETDAEGRVIFTEGGADLPVIVTIDRVLTEDLVVTLTSSDTTEATVFPEEVTIFAGTTEAFIFVSPQDDFDIDGDQFPTISATSPDANGTSAEIVVQDNDTLSNNAPTALRDNNLTSYDDLLAEADGVVDLSNVLLNDTDPDNDVLVVVDTGFNTSPGPVDTPDADGWFDWVDGNAGGEMRVNVNGDSQFRDIDGDFADLAADERETTFINYTIADPDGETSTTNIKVVVEGSSEPPLTTIDTVPTATVDDFIL